MRSLLVLAIALAWSLGSAIADIPPHVKAKIERDAAARKELSGKLGDALARGDTEAIGALLGAQVNLKGLWFPSEKCRKQFGGRAVAKMADAAVLAGCLAEVKLKLNANGYLVHEPGSTWLMIWNDGKLASLSTLEIDPASPTIDKKVLEKHARRSLEVRRDAKTRAMMKKDRELLVGVDLRVCVDATGKVDALSAKAEPAFESYRATVEAAAKKWAFKPFKHDGKAIRVCSPYWIEQYDGGGVVGGIEGGGGDDVPPSPPPPVRPR